MKRSKTAEYTESDQKELRALMFSEQSSLSVEQKKRRDELFEKGAKHMYHNIPGYREFMNILAAGDEAVNQLARNLAIKGIELSPEARHSMVSPFFWEGCWQSSKRLQF